jgi:hypothetical protein
MSDRKTSYVGGMRRDRAVKTTRLPQNRSGVILLVVMVLLALMTLLGLTLVLVTAQGRLSALAAARKGVQADHDNQELASVVTQVLAGSTDTNSSIGAHSLLEDLYGLPQFFGRIMPATAGATVLPIGETAAGATFLAGNASGSLLLLTVTAAEASGAAGLGPQTATQFVLPQNSGAFCGQVATMLTGPAAGESARVVGYYFVPGSQLNTPPGAALLQVSSFGGVVPQPGDEFMINGRPFSGTGFGLDLTEFQSGTPGVWATTPLFATGNVPLLTAFENSANVVGPPANVAASSLPVASWGMPYAYLPNHARISLTPWSPTTLTGAYWDPAGPGGANEPYDAPDFQNLMLAMHYWSPFLLPGDVTNAGHVITPIPSLHRPELVAWYYNQSIINPTMFSGTPAMANPALRRKVILRPEPTDNQFQDMAAPYGNVAGLNGVWDAREPYHDVNGNGYYDALDVYADGTPAFLDLNGDGAWTAGEPDWSGNTFNPVTGCWYIAANGGWALDTQNPPTYTPPSGLSGSASGLDVDNDGDLIPDSIWVDTGLPVHTESDGTLTKNLAAVLCIDLDGKVNLNAHGTLAHLDTARYTGLGSPSGPFAGGTATPGLYSDGLFQRNIPVGQGYGPADVNPLHLFIRSHNVNNGGTTVTAASALNYYKAFLQGFNYQTFLATYNGYPGATTPPVLQVDGRYGESARLTVPPATVPGFNYPGVFPPGSYNPPYPAITPLTWTQQILNGPRAGWSQWFDPYSTSVLLGSGFTAYWVNDPVALVRFSDIRPGLLTPPYLNATPFFFDFLDSYLPGTTTPAAVHLPTAHGTPSDLHSRGFLATDFSGRPYYAGTATFPWQVTGQQQTFPSGTGFGVGWQPPGFLNYWQYTMTDLAASEYASGGLAFMLGEATLNEGVDTQYEMNLTQNARQVGENSGNSVNNIPDFPTVDAKLTPTELEAILRSHEWGSGNSADPSKLQVKRLTDLEGAWTYLATGTYAPQTKTNLGNDNARLALTGESWDLPAPNLALTPRQMQDVVQYVNFMELGGYTTSLGNSATLTLNNVSLTELARARILADNYNPLPPTPSLTGPGFTTPGANTTPSMADLSLFGNLKNSLPNVVFYPTLNPAPNPMNPLYPIYPLLAPELVLGTRLDVNRLLGNGFDDNQNGVVDEPGEAAWVDPSGTWHTESLTYPFSQLNTTTPAPLGQVNTLGVVPTNMNNMFALLDLNNDGFYPPNPTSPTGAFADPQTGTPLPIDPTYSDMRARQLLAKHLYCLAMLLLDDRPYLVVGAGGPTPNPVQNVMAQVFNALGAPLPPGWPSYSAVAQGFPNTSGMTGTPAGSREQAAYVIAQWAVNVVDFRDRDSIMTPFEFDLYPFRADDATLPNVTWNVDDIIDPALGTPLPWSRTDDGVAWRGIVWGCERPELLMTETVAFHDRGTADTAGAQTIDDQSQNPPTGADTVTTNTGAMPYDKDFDQVRRPRGSLIVELYNPTSYWDAPQLDLQTSAAASVSGLPQPWNTVDGNLNRGNGIDLAQVAFGQPVNGTGPAASPVWRIAVAYAPKGWSAQGGTDTESMCYNTPPTGMPPLTGGGSWQASPQSGTQVIDPRVPILPPNAIHRAVYFTPFQQSFISTSGGVPGPLSTVADTLLNTSFFADPDIFGPTFNPATGLNSVPKQPTLLLPPGQYALVGPANQDVAGSGFYYTYAGYNNVAAGGNANNNAWKAVLGYLPNYNTISYVYSGGMPQGPYGAGYVPLQTTLTAAGTTSMKPVIGVPIQTNWYQLSGTLPMYAIHNSLGLTGTSTASGGVLTTLRMSVSEPEHGYPVWQNGAIPATGVVPTPNMPALQDDATYYSQPGTAAAGFGPFPQHPFDSGQGQPMGSGPTYTPYLQFGDQPNPCVAAVTGSTESTTLGYTVLYLQRLANPLQAWDEKMNPYITVDSMPVDLTSYTGEPAGSGGAAPPEMSTYYTVTGGINPTKQTSTWVASMTGVAKNFDTRRRGYDPSNNTTTVYNSQGVPNIWAPLSPRGGYTLGTNPYTTGGWGAGSNQSTYTAPMSRYGTLGYINYEYAGSIYPWGTFVYTNNSAATGTSGMPAYMYNGDPQTPFPWLAWNNRPYVSQYELMLVPASSPSSQAEDFGMLGWALAGTTMNEYQPYTAAPLGSALTPTAGMLPAAQFMQLLNFFNNEQTLSGTDTTNVLPNLYRIFEFLQVASRYTGTQEMLNPSQFSGDVGAQVGASVTGSTLLSASHWFHTPFNWLSRYRDPGRINLNTIFDPVVFKSLMDDYPGTLYANTGNDLNPLTGLLDAMLYPRGLYASLVQSRQGFYLDPLRPYMYGATAMAGPYTVNSAGTAILNPSAPPNPISQFAFNATGGVPGINSDVPTYFANPFRPDGSAAFVPPADVNPAVNAVYPRLNYNKLMHQWSYPGGLNNGVNATMLRSQDGFTFNSFPMVVNETVTPFVSAPGTPGPLAMFDDTAFDTNNRNATTNVGATYNNGLNTTKYRNPGQNAPFQYQMFNRLGNTTTNRSNVYAIWVTLGKFQVQEVGVSPTNPDGYKLVGPVMDGTGSKQVVTRGFYIFDRSIPMGFQRGQDLNVEKGLLVERVLQEAN